MIEAVQPTEEELDAGANLSPFYDLDGEVTEGGNNFSQGQRQLLSVNNTLAISPSSRSQRYRSRASSVFPKAMLILVASSQMSRSSTTRSKQNLGTGRSDSKRRRGDGRSDFSHDSSSLCEFDSPRDRSSFANYHRLRQGPAARSRSDSRVRLAVEFVEEDRFEVLRFVSSDWSA